MIDRGRWRVQVTVSMLVAAIGCSSESHDGGTGADQTAAGSGGTASGATTSAGVDSGNSSSAASNGSGGSGETSAVSATNAGGTSSATSQTSGAGTSGAAGFGAAGETGSNDAYANVVAVSATGSAGAYTFNVSVESSDIDCSQFADWWEVVSESGELLYRRILEHSHTDENGTSDADAPGNTFTRSGGPVDIQPNETVFVRAHLSTLDHYNGDVMQGSIDAGFTLASDLGADFAADLESAPPQPTGCAF